MAGPTSDQFTGVPKVEDVMASLAAHSVFDLEALARKLVLEAQKKAESEDDPGDVAFLITSFYALWHSEVPL
ncbi:hypothetical protein [Marmoricola sp. RAF53]|uniref:hypothetical protein n=1 Tax=Marmoricola sp. RAF53 TaxID=3233059 RepID=UPI003F96F02B